ncbi:MAG: hypothetical protein KJO82_05275 [Gammaproteobacteria bacterium]|nr:hypothetical protein [Gammaproteobacteria bacterium]
MNDFETAVDQILMEPSGANELELYEYENYSDYENFDDDFSDDEFELDDDDDLSNELEWSAGGDNEFDFEDENSFEWQGETGDTSYEFEYEGGSLSEAEVEDLARDLVNVSTPQEMEAFFGKLIKGVKKVAGKALSGGLGRKLLKAGSGLLGRALPLVGSSLGTALLPGIGTALGGRLGGQLRSLFSRRGRRSMRRSLTRQAVRSARRVGRRNPLTSILGRGGGQALRSLFGFEAEAASGNPQFEVAKRVIRTVADASATASRDGDESDAAVARAFGSAASRNLPPAIRAAMVSEPAAS